MADQSDKEDEQETNLTEDVADVVTDVTVRALDEFSTGSMPAAEQNADEAGETAADADGDYGGDIDVSDYEDEDALAELPPQDTSDFLACEGNELDELNDPGAPDQPDNDLEPDELVVLDPDHPLMVRFQKALRTQLEKHNEKLKLDLAETLLALRKKQKEREDIGVELYGVQYELANYQKTLENLQVKLAYSKQVFRILLLRFYLNDLLFRRYSKFPTCSFGVSSIFRIIKSDPALLLKFKYWCFTVICSLNVTFVFKLFN